MSQTSIVKGLRILVIAHTAATVVIVAVAVDAKVVEAVAGVVVADVTVVAADGMAVATADMAAGAAGTSFVSADGREFQRIKSEGAAMKSRSSFFFR